jgi:hypothetical protein
VKTFPEFYRYQMLMHTGMTKYQTNRHIWDVELSKAVSMRKVFNLNALLIEYIAHLYQLGIALEALYMVSTVATKISILLFYRRLIPGTVSKGFRWAVYVAMTSIMLYFFAFVILLFTRYQPTYADWMIGDPYWWAEHKDEVRGANEGIILASSAVISAVQDFLVCGMPMVVFWKMTIPKRERIALGAIFAVGIL